VGESQELGVSLNFLRGLSDEESLLKDTLCHLFKMVFESLGVLLKISDGLLKLLFEDVEVLLGSGFFIGVLLERVFDIFKKLFKHISNSADRSSVKEHIELRSGHLSKEGDHWSVVVREIDFYTGSEQHGCMSTQLSKGGLLSDEVIEDLQRTSNYIESISVIVRSSDEEFMTLISSLSCDLESTSRVSDISLGLFKINLSFFLRLGAGSEVVLSSSESSGSLLDLTFSEFFL